MRRLPVYFLLDTSGKMNGEPIQALNNALSGMIWSLRSEPNAVGSVWISIITFSNEVKEIVPLTDLENFQLPEITCPRSGPRLTGKAMGFLYDKVKNDIRKSSPTQKGDWKPLLFLFTIGSPNDMSDFTLMIPQIKSINFGVIVSCAAGYIKDDKLLKELTDNVVHLDTADGSTLKQFFKWVSDTIEQGNKSMGTTDTVLMPPPPSEVHLVI